jgi:hypothetical protein
VKCLRRDGRESSYSSCFSEEGAGGSFSCEGSFGGLRGRAGDTVGSDVTSSVPKNFVRAASNKSFVIGLPVSFQSDVRVTFESLALRRHPRRILCLLGEITWSCSPQPKRKPC